MSAPINYAELTVFRCSACKREKPVDNFYRIKDKSAPLTGWRYSYRCKDCNREQCKEYGQAGREKRNARLRAWRKSNPEKARAADKRKRVKQVYDLTPAQVEEMTARQEGKCAICRRNRKLVIDHHHDSGTVRELICARCNFIVGVLESCPEELELARAYILKHAESAE